MTREDEGLGDEQQVVRLIFQALAEDDWERAVRLMESHWEYLATRSPGVIRVVAAGLPEREMENPSRWLRLRDNSRLMVRSQAVPAAVGSDDPALLDRLAALTLSARASRRAGRAGEAHDAARDAVMILDAVPAMRRARVQRAIPEMTLEWARSLQAPLTAQPRASELLESAYAGAIGAGDHRTAVMAASELAIADAIAGRTGSARAWTDRATALHRANTGAAAPPPDAQLALALIAADALDFGEAIALLDGAARVPDMDTAAVARAWRELWTALGQGVSPAELDIGRPVIEPPQGRLGALLVQLARARLLMLHGLGQRSLWLLNPDAAGIHRNLLVAARASIELRLGEARLAEAEIATADAPEAYSPRADLESRAVRAAAALRRGEIDRAREHFTAAEALAATHGLPGILLWLPHDDLAQLAQLSHGSTTPEPLRTVLALSAQTIPVTREHGMLSRSEQRLIRAAIQHPGATVGELADSLGVSGNTMKSQFQSVYRKLGVATRQQMLRVVADAPYDQ